MGSKVQSDSIPDRNPARAERHRSPNRLRDWIEYRAARMVLGVLSHLPAKVGRLVCGVLAALCYWAWPKLRRVGLQSLAVAWPEWPPRRRRKVVFACFQNQGGMLADFARFPSLNRANIEELIVYDGFDHFANAMKQGKGLIFLTAHFGCWELGSFAHGIYGYPVNFVVRQLDNSLIDRMINHLRCLSGGRQRLGAISKQGNAMMRWLLVEAAQTAARVAAWWTVVHRETGWAPGLPARGGEIEARIMVVMIA